MIVFEKIGQWIIAYPLVVVAILVVMNLISLIAYVADKKKAQKGAWRIPEATLIGLAWAFGGVGAMIGMYVFRHKTKHTKFKILVPLAFIVQIAFFVLCAVAAVA